MTANKGEMSNSKADEAAPAGQVGDSGAPPAYEPTPADSRSASSPTPADPDASLVDSKTAGPTADAPFRFPVDGALPAYSPPTPSQPGPSTPTQKLIAIPQVQPTPTSAFLKAYAPTLLRHGIVEQTFLSFLETLSAFLAAKVSDRAVAHAADVASQVGEGPKSHFKHVYGHTKDVFRNIGSNAKKGNIFGAVGGIIGGTVTVPVSAALGSVGAVVSLPGRALGAVAKKPLTQRQRAEAYVAVANKDWFWKRGLEAALGDSGDVAGLLGVGVAQLTEGGAEGISGGLGGKIERLEVADGEQAVAVLEVGLASLWLVLRRVEGQEGSA